MAGKQKKYGLLSRLTDFIRRCGEENFSQTLRLIETLDDVQTANPSVTIIPYRGDGVRVHYSGRMLIHLHPRKAGLRLVIWFNCPELAENLVDKLDSDEKIQDYFEERQETKWYRNWYVSEKGVAYLERWLRKLPVAKSDAPTKNSRARAFPGDIRQAVLNDFIKRGHMCPGLSGDRKVARHKVDMNKVGIAFDHILPYKHGGSNEARNIQVLCSSCNAKKAATAL